MTARYTYTNQEAFDRVLERVIEQGAPCVGTAGRCVYKFDDRRCAAGWLVPDDHPLLTADFCDIGGWLSATERFPDLKSLADLALVAALQNRHDSCAYTTPSHHFRSLFLRNVHPLISLYNLNSTKWRRLAIKHGVNVPA